jgi:hypothetical protein
MAHYEAAPRGGLEQRVCLLSVFCCTPSHQGAGECSESDKEVAADTVGKLGPGPIGVIRVSGIQIDESEPAAQPGQSAVQIPPHHFDDSGP